jgi:hypothetical protein
MANLDLGFDYGYWGVKALDGSGNRISFPTVYSRWDNRFQEDISKFEYVLTIDEVQYAVGKFASLGGDAYKRWSKTQQLDAKSLKIYLGTALYLLTKNSDEVRFDVNLSVGLPIEHFVSQQEDLLKTLKEIGSISVNDKVFTIFGAIVNRQGAGAFLSLLFDSNGEPREDTNQKLIYGGGLIDVGYRTIDIIKVRYSQETGFILKDSESATLDSSGMRWVYQATADELNQNFGTTKNAIDIENALKDTNGEFILMGMKINFKKIFEAKCAGIADKISNFIATKWSDIEELGVIYLTGGGAEYLLKYLDLGKVEIQVQNDPAFANASGYLAKLLKQKTPINV